ncbi:type II toxin-antitoxin system RelB/DinJ family antitoxin [Synergistaceae bacterium OttesenSCG-928-I11]|nr:type II toxin-antitoxin system RelB/DinJ family antitoxin [Synergistaceae bacterium OttesenSCG-928-I11]
MPTKNISIRMDEDLKSQFETVVGSLGLNVNAAVNVFAKAVVRCKGIPFELTSREEDPFYSPSNFAAIRESLEQIKNGQIRTFHSVEELEKAALKAIADAD